MNSSYLPSGYVPANTYLHETVRNGHIEDIIRFVDAGEDMNTKVNDVYNSLPMPVITKEVPYGK